VGRPRRSCRRSCRQRAFEARRLAGDLAWSDDRLVRMAAELAELEDRIDAIVDAADELRVDVEDGRCAEVADVLERLEEVLGPWRRSSRRGTTVLGARTRARA
jgi:hypothetical protein